MKIQCVTSSKKTHKLFKITHIIKALGSNTSRRNLNIIKKKRSKSVKKFKISKEHKNKYKLLNGLTSNNKNKKYKKLLHTRSS